MIISRRFLIVLICLSGLGSCLRIHAGTIRREFHSPDEHRKNRVQEVDLRNSKKRTCRMQEVNLEPVNFRLKGLDSAWSGIQAALESSNSFQKIYASQNHHAPFRLRVVLERFPLGKHRSDYLEKKPSDFFIRQINLNALRLTLGLVPLYEKHERRLTFEIWQRNHLVEIYTYTLHLHSFFGVPIILMLPFFDRNELDKDLHAMTLHFLVDVCNTSGSPLLLLNN